jgi:hypothetical protein
MRAAWLILPFVIACTPAASPTPVDIRDEPQSDSHPGAPGAQMFTFDDDDLHVPVGLPVSELCLVAGSTTITLRDCPNISVSTRRDLTDHGVLQMVLARNPSGGIAFQAKVTRSLYAVTMPDAFEEGMLEAVAKASTKLVKDPSKSNNLVIHDGSRVLRGTFNVAGPHDPGDVTHMVFIAVGGRGGLYALSWLANEQRAAEVDAAADRAITGILHRDDHAGATRLGIEEIVNAQQPRVLACYRQQLAKDPTMKGTMSVELVIRDDGYVDSAVKSAGDGLSPTTEECALAVFRPLRFAPPTKGGAKIAFPLRFTQ